MIPAMGAIKDINIIPKAAKIYLVNLVGKIHVIATNTITHPRKTAEIKFINPILLILFHKVR